jgi:hypothetical protein
MKTYVSSSSRCASISNPIGLKDLESLQRCHQRISKTATNDHRKAFMTALDAVCENWQIYFQGSIEVVLK